MTTYIRRHIFPILLALAGLSACGGDSAGPALALPPPPVALDPGMLGDGNMGTLVEAVRANHNAVSLGAVVVDGGMVADLATSGRRSIDAVEVVADADKWHLGSITKAMTATLAGVLVEQGVIDWDTTPIDLWPGQAGTMQPQYGQATLIQFLAHQSGLPEDITTIPSIREVGDAAPGIVMQ